MASPDEYRQQISDLGLDRMSIEASSVAEGKAALKQVRSLQKQLRHIKKAVNLDMKTIRAEYKQKIAEAGTTGLTGLLTMGRGGSKVRAAEKRSVRNKRDSILAPYDNIKLTIDDLLVQLDGAKMQLQKFIEEAKAEGRAQKRPLKAAKALCSQCGQAVDEGDRFCRGCGHQLGNA